MRRKPPLKLLDHHPRTTHEFEIGPHVALARDGLRSMVQEPPDNLLWDSGLDRRRREGVTQRMHRARNMIMVPGDDVPRPAVPWKHPAVIEISYGIEQSVMALDEWQIEGAARLRRLQGDCQISCVSEFGGSYIL